MANVHEALKRAEAERQRKIAGDQQPAPASLPWEAETAATRRSGARKEKRGRLRRLFDFSGSESAEAGDENKRRYSILQPESYVAEQFRMLRGRIDSIAAQRPIRTLAVTSANANEGKSTACLNLAAVTGMSVGRRVLVIDCDMRRPSIHSSLGLQPQAGLAEVLTDRASLDDAIIKVEGLNLDVLAVRNQPDNPSELLASSQMRSLIEEVVRRYDRVILDTPACLGMPDAKVVSELCDGMVFVVRADVTPKPDVEAALEVLDRSRVLGLVLNGSDARHERYGYY